MGNANALIQSDDWAALVADAKSRNCYMDMEALPKDFLVLKGPSYAPLPAKVLSNARGLRSAGPRHRTLDMHMESRSGAQTEEDEKLNAAAMYRNGNYRSYKPSFDNSLDDVDQSGDKSRDSWQYAIQRKQNPSGLVAKRDL